MAVENFGILDVDWTGQSVQISIRHFDKHGHPYALLSRDDVNRLITLLKNAVAKSKAPAAPSPPEPEIDAADFEF